MRLTAQSPSPRIKDYKRSFFIFNADNLSVHEKINVRSNILKCAMPVTNRLLINY